MAIITGTPGPDTLFGTADDDTIAGTAGDDFLVGGEGNDLVNGDDGDDNLRGNGGDDVLNGGAGNDLMRGGDGVDSFDGGTDYPEPSLVLGSAGDRISFYDAGATQGVVADLRTGIISNDGFGNVETMVGIEGLGSDTAFVDTFYGNDGANTLLGGLGDFVYGFGGDDSFQLSTATAVLDGGDGIDTLSLTTSGGQLLPDANGDGLAETLEAATTGFVVSLRGGFIDDGYGNSGSIAGIENVNGSELGDVIFGDSADNVLDGGDGDDIVQGGAGNDALRGGNGNDLLRGGEGVDSFDGGSDDPDVSPVTGNVGDRISFYEVGATQGVVADLRTGIISNDGFGNVETMVGIEGLGADTAFIDTLYGNDSANTLFAGLGDFLYGFGGDDSFLLSAATAVLDGGNGIDTLSLQTTGGQLIPDSDGDGLAETLDAAATGFFVNLAAGTISDGYGNSGTIAGIENIEGSELNDVMIGNAVDNVFRGNGGDDFLTGGPGFGFNVLDGGDGNDTAGFFLPAPFFAGTYSIEAGTGANAGKLVVMLTNAGGSQIVATISGDSSTVTVTGAGNGAFLGTNIVTGIETLAFGIPSGDTVNPFAAGAVAANVVDAFGLGAVTGGTRADIILGSDADETLRGGDGNDLVKGDDGSDTLQGEAGNDTLSGGAGDDQLEGGADNDVLDGGAGNDVLIGGTGNDVYVINAGDTMIENPGEGTDELRVDENWGMWDMTEFENLTALGTGDWFLAGNAGANVITGNSGNNYIVGEGGNDAIDGGAGDDIASFQLPAGTSGDVTLVDGTGEDAGKLLVQLVNGGIAETIAKVTLHGAGSATVEGVGPGAFLGTDTVTNVEDLHFFVQPPVEGPPASNQFVNVQLAVRQFGDFVGGSEGDDVIDLSAFPGALNSNGNRGNDTILGNDSGNFISGGAGDDSIDGRGGQDFATFALATGTTGSLALVEGSGADEGTLLVQLIDGGSTETVARVTVSGSGAAIVEGLGRLASLGTDTVTNVEQLHFTIPTADGSPLPPNQFVGINLVVEQFGNFIAGSEGDDVIDLGAFAGATAADGRHGDDTIIGSAADDYMFGGAGDDTIVGTAGFDVAAFHLPQGVPGALRVVAGTGADAGLLFVERVDGTLVETVFRVSFAGDGTATVTGLGSAAFLGTDTVSGVNALDFNTDSGFTHIIIPEGTSAGDDFIGGGPDSDVLFGGAGDDQLRGNAGDDLISGGDGNDLMRGGAGVDRFDGGADYPEDSPVIGTFGDRISFFEVTATQGVVADLRSGVIANDGFGNVESMTGIEGLGGDTAFADTFFGNDNANWLFGNRGDSLFGFGGDDRFQLGSASAVLDGGTGLDTLYLTTEGGWLMPDSNGDGFAESAGPATNGFFVNLGAGTISDGYGNSGSIAGIENIEGSELNDVMIGDAANNVFRGWGGDDFLTGGPGFGFNVLDGGDGNDTAGFFLPAAFFPGTYSIEAGTGANLGKLVVMLTNGGGSQIVATIDAASSTVTVAGAGNGSFFGTNIVTGIETLAFGIPSGNTVNPFAAGAVAANVFDAFGLGAVVGGTRADIILGSDADESLRGGDGNDLVKGDDGDDVVQGNNGNDLLFGGEGNDLLRGGAGVDYFDGGGDYAEASMVTGTSGDRISFFETTATQGVVADLRTGIISNDGFGNVETMAGIESLGSDTAFADTLYGNDGINWLLAGPGDFLYGFGGDDQFFMSATAAVLDGGEGLDTLTLTGQGGFLTPDADGDGIAESAAAATVGFVVDLGAGTMSDGYGHSGTVTGIENIIASDLGDTITGDGANNMIEGLGGDDRLDAGTGSDDVALFTVAPGSGGTLEIVDGPDAATKLVRMTLDGVTETVATITIAGSVVTVTGQGQGASLGTDTLTHFDRLAFTTQFVDGAGLPDDYVSLSVGSGVVADGLVAGATVFMDANRNGILDAGEASTVTGADGSFLFLSPGSGPIVAFGGANVDTGLPNLVTMTAPTGSGVINPLTTLIQTVLDQGGAASAEEAASVVASGFGLSSGLDLLNTDLVGAAAAGDSAALAAQKVAATIVSIVVAASDASGSAEAGASVLASLAELASGAEAGTPVDLTDTEVLEEVLGGTVDPAQVGEVAAELGETAQAIQDAEDLSDLSDAQAAALTRGNDLDNELQGGDQADELLGFRGDDVLRGRGGNDVLDGGLGADLMIGGVGDDTYRVDHSGDTVVEAAGEGDDTVVSTIDYVLDDHVENLVLDGRARLGFGNDGDNRIEGNDLANALYGGDGNDVLAGGGGPDLLVGGAGEDTADYASSPASPWTHGGVSVNLDYGFGLGSDATADLLIGVENIRGSAFADRLTGDDGANRLWGEAGDDRLDGQAGDDRLEGGDGADRLSGGLGRDVLAGGDGADLFVFDSVQEASSRSGHTGWNADVILDFQAGGASASSSIDRLDLSGIDARSKTGKEDAFTFIGSNAFTGTAGQLHAINTGAVDDNGRAIYLVEGDTNGDRVADFQISLHVDGILGAADFVF